MEAKKQETMNKTGQAMAHLSAAMNDDPAYAWSWHCTIACCAMDEGLAHEAADKAAARFMRLAFDVNTDKAPNAAMSGAEPALSAERPLDGTVIRGEHDDH